MKKKSLSENIIRVENSILSLDKKSWDKCANPKNRDFNPFIGYEFLKALELSGSINGESGWLSSYITLLDNNNDLKGCMPSYIKNNFLPLLRRLHYWGVNPMDYSQKLWP